MEFLQKPPEWLTSKLPDGAKSFLEGGGWFLVLGVGGLILLLIFWAVMRKVFGALFGCRPKKPRGTSLGEDLSSLPPPPALTGDRRLTVEGVPVRLRLVVVAPAGRAYDINPDAVQQILDTVLPGLGKIAEDDQPEARVWPFQLSYEGFANQFHNNILPPDGDGLPSRWVLLAGRAQLGKNQIMLGLALQAGKPTTVGRLRMEKHEWNTTLRIKTRE